jgi:hypothetical protein
MKYSIEHSIENSIEVWPTTRFGGFKLLSPPCYTFTRILLRPRDTPRLMRSIGLALKAFWQNRPAAA